MLHPRRSTARPSVITVIFDADDTLWETQPLYTQAKERFFEEMHYAGFPRDEVRRRFETIDHANVSTLGFSKQRFPQSMRDTYETLCIEYARPFDEAKAQRVLSIGATVFEASPRIFAGVDETLAELRAEQVRLLLATKGDREVQARRVDSSCLRHYFDRVYILDDKGTREFEWIVAEEAIDVSSGWSVGNSARSDINPALAVGLHAIWVPYRTWIYEDEEPLANPRLRTAKSLREVSRIVLGDE